MIYSHCIEKIRDVLESVPHVQEVHAHPLGREKRAKKYPAVIFVPDTVDNSFSDTASNHRIIRFKMWIIVNSGNVQDSDVFERVLPSVVDAVIGAFDKQWDFSTIGGHRTWARLTGGLWGLSQEEQSVEAWAELTLEVRLDTPAA